MSLVSTGSSRAPLHMHPNASFVIEEVTDDEDVQQITPHALHNKRFTKKYLKSVFPSGFGVQNARIGEDLVPNQLTLLAKKRRDMANLRNPQANQASIHRMLLTAESPSMVVPVGLGSPEASISLASLEEKNSLASNMTSPIVPNLSVMNTSLASHVKLASNASKTLVHVKGTTGTFAPVTSFTDAFKGKEYLKFDRCMDDSLVDDDLMLRSRSDKGAPDDFADVAGPYFTEIQQAVVGTISANVPVVQPITTESIVRQNTAQCSPGSAERPDTTSQMLKNVGKQVAQEKQPLFYSLLDVPHGMSYSMSSEGSEIRPPPQANKELVARSHVLWQKPSGLDKLKEYVSRARIPDVRSSANSMQVPAFLAPLPSSLRSATGIGGVPNNTEVHGVPKKAPFGLFGSVGPVVDKSVGSWELGASIAGEAASRAGYGPAQHVGESDLPSPANKKKLLTLDEHNASGFLLSYDQWMKSGDDVLSQDPIHSATSIAKITTTDTSTNNEIRVGVTRSRQGPKPIDKSVKKEESSHAGGLGYQVFPDFIHVRMYSFQSVLKTLSVDSMKVQYEFDMARDITLEQLSQLVVKKASQINVHELRFDDSDEAQPVIFAFTGVGNGRQTWRPIEKALDWSNVKLNSLSFLKDPIPLHLMYSMHLNEDLDEAFLFENTTTLAELRDFEKLGYAASSDTSAGFGLRQIQGNGSPAASRTRANTAPSTSEGIAIRIPENNIGGDRGSSERAERSERAEQRASTANEYTRSLRQGVRDPRPQSPTVSRSSNKAVAASSLSSASGNIISKESKARPTSPDFAKTKFQLMKTHPFSPNISRQISPENKLTSTVLNELAGGLLGVPVVAPPALHAHDFPRKMQRLEQSSDCDNDDDRSVGSMHSLHSLRSQHASKITATLNTVDMNLMSKYGSPPRPSFGHKMSTRAQSPRDNKKTPEKKGKIVFPTTCSAPKMSTTRSLATLLFNPVHSRGTSDAGSVCSGGGNISGGSSVMPISQVRDIQKTKSLMASMSIDKQIRIATELENRLMLTKW